MTSFMQKIEAKWDQGKHVCVGLDPDYGKIPERHKIGRGRKKPLSEVLDDFCRHIVVATLEKAAAYKPNIAFFEEHGEEGLAALKMVICFINEKAPSVPVILDAKRGDIGNTNECYARMAFDVMRADALTIHPYLGWEANKPFLDRADKGIFVLCRTSNPGAGEFQDYEVLLSPDPMRMYDGETGANITGGTKIVSRLFRRVAEHVDNPETWNQHGNCALVAGATYPDDIRIIRNLAQNLPLLIPGIGKQGGDLEASVRAARHRFLINSSSGIIFADDPRAETLKLHEGIKAVLANIG